MIDDFSFFTQDPSAHEEREESLEDRFARERKEWDQKIAEASKKMKQVFDIPELMTHLYTDRQRAVEYYHYLISLMIKMNKKYNVSYVERWEYYTNKSQVRYPNETTKNIRIQVDLQEQVEKRAMLDNHSKFMVDVKNSLDHIIWAVTKRVEIEKMSRGD